MLILIAGLLVLKILLMGKQILMMIVDMERMLRESWLEIVTFQGDTVGVVYAKAISYPSC